MMPVALDRDLDKQLLLILERDGRLPVTDLARLTGVSYHRVRRRLDDLLQSGVLRIAAQANPFQLGHTFPVIMTLQVEASRLTDAIERLTTMPELRYVAQTAGSHNVIIEGYFPSNRDLYNFVVHKLEQVPAVNQSVTSVLLEIYRLNYRGGPIASDQRRRLWADIRGRLDRIDDDRRRRLQDQEATAGLVGWSQESDQPSTIDELDRQIVYLLQQDGRRSYAGMADVLSASEETVRRRSHRLLSDKIIRIAGFTDPVEMGMTTPMFIRITCDRAHLETAAERVSHMERTVFVAATTGSQDLIVMGYFPDTRGITAFYDRVAGISGVLRVDMSLVLRIHKQVYDWARVWSETVAERTARR